MKIIESDIVLNDSIWYLSYVNFAPDELPVRRLSIYLGEENNPLPLKGITISEPVFDSLVSLFNDPNRDWAAHLILACIFDMDARLIERFKNNQNLWREENKLRSYKYWLRYKSQVY